MKKPEIARRMARQGKTSSAEAADHLDRVVNEILASLKRGKSADLPGLGSFRHIAGGRIRFDQENKSRG
jgi:nucleoid DNA-binding protein